MADTQTPAAAPLPGTAEYDAAMVAKFENRDVVASPNADTLLPNTDNPVQAERPTEVPEKFWDAKTGTVNYAAWAKSTGELEAALTRSKQSPAQAQQTPAVGPVKAHEATKATLTAALTAAITKEGATLEEITAAQKALADHGEPPKPATPNAADAEQAGGFKMEDLSAEYTEKGALSDESYAKLEKGGIPRDMVDAYIEGQKALVEQQRAASFKIVGGEEKYTEMVTWAKSNLTSAEAAAYNAAVAGTPEARALAISGLNQRFTVANGSDPALVNGGNRGPSTSGFRSNDEMKLAMRDKRYNVDPAYTNDVMQKVAAGMMAGTI